MFDPDALTGHLKEHLRLSQEILAVVERENVALRQADSSSAEFIQAKKDALPKLTDSVAELRRHRAEWLKLPAETRAAHPQIAGLLRQNQDVIMKIIVLDRENEQTLLRKGLVPTRHLPPANRNRPHYVANLYRKSGNS